MTTRLLPITQNTDLVTFSIEINGAPLPNHIPVFSIEVMQEVNRVPVAMITLADGDASTGEWRISSEEFFIPGNEITVYAGYQNENEPVFTGIVISQSLKVRNQRLELHIECKHKAIVMTTVKNSRHFTDMTDSDAIASILDENDIPAGIIESTNATHIDLVQYHCLDWDFIMIRMEANGLVCIADEDGFHAIVPDTDAEPITSILFGANVYEFDAGIDSRTQCGTVEARSWDPAEQSEIISQDSEPLWQTTGNLSPASLAAAAGASVSILRHSGTLAPDELHEWANSTKLRSRAAFLRGRVRIKGLPAAKPGKVVELAGFGDRFNGSAWIGAIRHEISNGIWYTDIEFGIPKEMHASRFEISAPPAGGLLAAINGMHTGVVTALENDPAGEARIRVKIPSIDLNGEGIWARVATLDAGSSRGTFFLPEIDDEVVIGFLNEDPRHPVVMGMLHSSAHPPPEEAEDDNHIKGYTSRSGMRLRFDDDSVSITVETPDGNSIILDDDEGHIAIKDKNGNKIVMSSEGISLQSAGDLILKASGDVKLESQANTEIKAGAQFQAEGSAGAEIESTGITTIKGSLVQIN